MSRCRRSCRDDASVGTTKPPQRPADDGRLAILSSDCTFPAESSCTARSWTTTCGFAARLTSSQCLTSSEARICHWRGGHISVNNKGTRQHLAERPPLAHESVPSPTSLRSQAGCATLRQRVLCRTLLSHQQGVGAYLPGRRLSSSRQDQAVPFRLVCGVSCSRKAFCLKQILMADLLLSRALAAELCDRTARPGPSLDRHAQPHDWPRHGNLGAGMARLDSRAQVRTGSGRRQEPKPIPHVVVQRVFCDTAAAHPPAARLFVSGAIAENWTPAFILSTRRRTGCALPRCRRPHLRCLPWRRPQQPTDPLLRERNITPASVEAAMQSVCAHGRGGKGRG